MGTQHRKQTQSEGGGFVPVDHEPEPAVLETPEPVEVRQLKKGDKITLSGKVLDVVELQGGQRNYQCELPTGILWIHSDHLPDVPK